MMITKKCYSVLASFFHCGPRGKKTATITASGISRVLMLQLASIYVQ